MIALLFSSFAHAQSAVSIVRTDKEVNVKDDEPKCNHKLHAPARPDSGGVVSHRWYSERMPQYTQDRICTDDATREYYLITYGFDVFELFPDYPRWTVTNPTVKEVTEYKLRVAEYIESNERFKKFMQQKIAELSPQKQ